MLLINFDDLVSEHPEIARPLRKLEAWVEKHPNAGVIYPSVLAREMSDVDPVALATALTLLVKAGFLRRVYKVTTPDDVLSDDDFTDPRDIPEKLSDRWNHPFDTAESDVVPVFQMVE